MISRIALAAAFVLVIACGETPPAAVASGGSGGSVQGGSSGAGGSAAGTASGGQNAGSGTGGAATGGAGAGGTSAGSGGGGGTAGGGGTGGAGGNGGGGGAAGGPSLVQPIMRGELDVLELGPLSFAINPSKGARIVSFKLDGDELLTGPTQNANYYGSTLWTSPADDWVVPGTFVPPAIVDSMPYTTTVSPEGVISATSAPYTTPNAKQFVVSKTFHFDLAKNAIVIDYGLKNTGAAPFRLSHWEVTRVFPGGLMFFPSGTTTKLDFLKQAVKVQQAQGYTWYDNTTHVNGMGESKAGADSPGGFVAQVAPNAKGDLLFIKAFKAISIAAEPTGHYPIEFYCNDPHTYVELEDHSSFDEIAAGATYTQSVTWYLRRLPMGTDRSVGSAALIAAAMSALGK
jgi:hypothetical protein